MTITHSVLTHFHADFVAGHIELRDRIGAKIALGSAAEADYEFVGLKDSETLHVGEVRVQVLHTPGHTPEGISLLVFENADAEEPTAVLTGDTLFIGDVGRPDLMASVGVTAEELASWLYDSLHEKLLPLPDKTLVYPGHGAGSLCGRALSDERVSTMGEQRQYNYALAPMDKETFIELVTADQPPAPEYFAYDAGLNKSERPSMLATSEAMTLEEVLKAVAEGAQLLDVRESGSFAAKHMTGATNIGLNGQFASWVGSILDPHRAIVVVADPGEEENALIRLGRVGFDNISGHLDGGMASLEGRDDLMQSFERYAPNTLREELSGSAGRTLIDIRRTPELLEGTLPGSIHIPLDEIQSRLHEIPKDRPVTVYCAGGYRSAVAASILQREGFTDVTDIVGGYSAWAATEPVA